MLEVKDLSVIYGGQTVALAHVSAEIPSGQIVGIIGPNGAGKSSFIKGILDMVDVRKGHATYNGVPLENIRHHIAYVEQRSQLDLDFPVSVFDCVLMGTYPTLGWLKRPGEKERAKAAAALERVQLTPYKDRQIGELSGGQFQRVLIARTLAQEAELIFLDEPFVGVDVKSERIIMEQLRELKREGKTLMIVHHDLGTVEEYFDSLLILNHKKIADGSVAEVFTPDVLKEAFGSDVIIEGKDGEAS